MYIALNAAEDDAAGNAHAGPLAFRLIGRQAQNVADGHVPVEAAAPRVDAQFLDLAQLLRSVGLKIVGRCGHGSGFLLEVRQ
jgi:hypothetical protein